MISPGKKHVNFNSMTEFNQWKEREEEITYTTYIWRDRTYQPSSGGKIRQGVIKLVNA